MRRADMAVRCLMRRRSGGGVRRMLVVAGACASVCLGWASAAQAAPVFRLSTLSASTAAPGSTLNLILDVRDVGDSPTDGSPVTVRATLPPGLTAVSGSVIHRSLLSNFRRAPRIMGWILFLVRREWCARCWLRSVSTIRARSFTSLWRLILVRRSEVRC